MPWSNQGGGPWGSGRRARGARDRSTRADRRRPISKNCCAAARTSCAAFCRAAISAAAASALIVLAAVALWGFSGFFRVEPDELGVVLRFGKFMREVPAGPELSPALSGRDACSRRKALRVNKIDIGMRPVEDLRRGSTRRATCRKKA